MENFESYTSSSKIAAGDEVSLKHRNRYSDQELGRFVTIDSMQDIGGPSIEDLNPPYVKQPWWKFRK